MEKRGVIQPGRTPEEHQDKVNNTAEKSASDEIQRLDDDFRKRAAETVVRVKPAK